MSDSEEEVEYEPENFVIAGHSLDITTIAFMPITQLMNNRGKDVEISGQKLWCGSLGVIQYLLNNSSIVADANVVELGAGTGVLGMICRKLNAQSVILTDHDEKSLTHMRSDLLTNNIEATVLPLNWYDAEIGELQAEFVPDKPLRVVAGDVLYKRPLLEPFFSTVKRVFAVGRDAQLLLCHIPRAGVQQEDVVEYATSVGFCVEKIPDEEWNKGDIFQYCAEEDLVRAKLYRLRLTN